MVAHDYAPSPRALGTLFELTLRQHLRGRRWLILSLLFALPSVVAALANLTPRRPPPAGALDFALAFNLMPHALAPLAALLYAAGIIRDEAEEQTLTYLYLRPLPRWTIYAVKLLATLLVTCLLTAVFTMVLLVTIPLTGQEPVTQEMMERALTTTGLLALLQVSYCAGFGLLGLITRRSLIVGIGYIILFEGLLATLDTVIRRLTAMYYFRVLVLRWLDPPLGKEWSINLDTAPSASTCVLVLLGTGLILTAAASWLFTVREFRMKTPEEG
jgi:ABC-2 type transport system permease protein